MTAVAAVLLAACIGACTAAKSSIVSKAKRVVAARVGGGDGVTFLGAPIVADSAVCGEVQNQNGTAVFVAQINKEDGGGSSIGQVDLAPADDMGAISETWNKFCGGQITIGPAAAGS